MAGGEGLNLLPTRVAVQNSDGIGKKKVTNRKREREEEREDTITKNRRRQCRNELRHVRIGNM